LETLATLKKGNIQSAGAGKNLEEAQQPVILQTAVNSRILIFSCGHGSSGIPKDWAAGQHKLGVWLLKNLSDQTVEQMQTIIQTYRRREDIVVVSIHWGGNWGFKVNDEHIQFAHELIDRAGADIVHGHSSHHIRGIDVYKGKPILYGCGDFLNDYEGIRGHEEFRGDLALMYFITMNAATGKLVKLIMTPTQTRRFQVKRALPIDVEWMKYTLNREGRRFGTRVEFDADFRLGLLWS
jgi:poly-gamma-glutamate capsule biosynthesis protein CapA/YwtB (metallophosphatase superfamily)